MSGSYTAPPVDYSIGQVTSALDKYLPQYTKDINAQILPTEQAIADASKVLSPQYYQQAVQNYNQFGPQLAQAAGNIQNASNVSDLSLVNGSGGQLAQAENQLQRQINPEFYKTLGLTSDKLNAALGAASPGLSGSERAEIERYIGGQGGQSPGSQVQTTAHAMQFGQGATDKLAKFTNVVGNVANNLGNLRLGNTDAFATATGKNGSQGTSLANNTLGGGFFSPGNSGQQMGSQLGQDAFQAEMNRQNVNSKKKTGWENAGDAMSVVGKGIGSIAGGIVGSDINSKTDIKSVDVDDILGCVEGLTISSWKYKEDVTLDQETHIGPMAQDWQRRLGIGTGKTINLIDANGVALASIQALLYRVRALEETINVLLGQGK